MVRSTHAKINSIGMHFRDFLLCSASGGLAPPVCSILPGLGLKHLEPCSVHLNEAIIKFCSSVALSYFQVDADM